MKGKGGAIRGDTHNYTVELVAIGNHFSWSFALWVIFIPKRTFYRPNSI